MEESMTEGQAPRFVSAAEITRNFGMWQDRAGQGPLIVTHHGRPRCVLLSADAWRDISERPGGPTAQADRAAIEHDLLAERIDLAFLALDRALTIRSANALAAMTLGRPRDALIDLPLADVLPGWCEGPVATQLRHTLRTGEQAQLLVPHAAGRLRVHIFPWPDGVALTLRAAGEEDDADQLAARSAARGAALSALGSVGIADLSVRGTIVSADRAFAAMTGFQPERLVGVRASDLLTVASRVPVTEAVERVLSRGSAAALDARLLVNGGEERPIRVALAPLNEGYAIGGAVMAVA
jgi:PAS domain S-box-containing protein